MATGLDAQIRDTRFRALKSHPEAGGSFFCETPIQCGCGVFVGGVVALLGVAGLLGPVASTGVAMVEEEPMPPLMLLGVFIAVCAWW